MTIILTREPIAMTEKTCEFCGGQGTIEVCPFCDGGGRFEVVDFQTVHQATMRGELKLRLEDTGTVSVSVNDAPFGKRIARCLGVEGLTCGMEKSIGSVTITIALNTGRSR